MKHILKPIRTRFSVIGIIALGALASSIAQAQAQEQTQTQDQAQTEVTWQSALNLNDNSSAIPLLEISALEGDGVAALNLAQLYDFGIGVIADKKRANAYYKVALRANAYGGELVYGLFLTDRSAGEFLDIAKGQEYLLQAADAGFDRAYLTLSLLALTGAGGDRNEELAAEWGCRAKSAGYDVSFLSNLPSYSINNCE